VLSLPLLFAIFFVVGTMAVVFDIAWNSLFVAVTRRDQYVQANSLLNGSRSLSSVGGPALAGILIQLVKAPTALLADALSFVASAFFLNRIHAPEAPIEHDPGSLRTQLAAGLGFLIRDPIIRPTLLSVATMNLFNYCFQGLFVLYVLKQLGVDPGVLGVALGAAAVGSVLGAIVAARIGRRLGIGRAFALGLVLFPASIILVPVAGPEMSMPLILGLLFAAEFGSGFGLMILDINAGALLLARTPDRIRGRVNGAFRFVNMGIRPIGAVLGGVLGGLFGVRDTLLVVTVAQLAGVLWLVGSPVLRLHDLPEAPED
jgi:MFS family permease